VCDLDADEGVEAELGEVGLVLVGEEGLPLEVCAQEAEAAEAARADALSADVGEVEAGGVADDDELDLVLAVDEDADEAPQVVAEEGELCGELLRDEGAGAQAAVVELLQGLDGGVGEAGEVAVDVGSDVGPPGEIYSGGVPPMLRTRSRT
jgi:hypothetical protein